MQLVFESMLNYILQDYFHIVKRPMDLSTIRSKLESGEYTDPWNILDDVWLMFDNAWLYNRKTSKVYKYCTKVREERPRIIQLIAGFMQKACEVHRGGFTTDILCRTPVGLYIYLVLCACQPLHGY